MLAGLPMRAEAVDELAPLVSAAGADHLADRLERALADEVKLLALILDERALMLSAFEIRRRPLRSCGPSCSTITSGAAAKAWIRRIGRSCAGDGSEKPRSAEVVSAT